MFIADLPRRQRFGEAIVVELRIGTGSRHRPHVDDEIDAGLPEQIDKFGDRPGGMADGEECVRVGSGDMANAVNRGGITAELSSKHTVSTRGFRRMVDARSSVCVARGSEALHPARKSS
jgi:hypothetical protein